MLDYIVNILSYIFAFGVIFGYFILIIPAILMVAGYQLLVYLGKITKKWMKIPPKNPHF